MGFKGLHVSTAEIADGSITTVKVAGGAITADKITVSELAAIAVSTGSLNVTGDIVTTTGEIATGLDGEPRVVLKDFGAGVAEVRLYTAGDEEINPPKVHSGYLDPDGGTDDRTTYVEIRSGNTLSGLTHAGNTASLYLRSRSHGNDSAVPALAWLYATEHRFSGFDAAGSGYEVLRLTAGTGSDRVMVLAPLAFSTTDLDTYITRVGENNISIYTGGTLRWSVDGSGIINHPAGGRLNLNMVAGNVINTASSDASPLQIYQSTAGKGAFMTFHVGGDYATYFGVSGALNDLAVGGWSMGAAEYLMFHQGNHGRRAYSAHTGDQTGIGAGTTDLTGLSVTFTAVSSHTYRISGFVSDFQRTAGLATDDRHSLDIRNSGGTAYQRAFFTYFNATAGYSGAQYVECLVAGLSGSQTFKLTHSRLSGGATISKRASGSEPSWILVEDIGI